MHAVRLEYTTRPRLLPIYARGLLVRRSGPKHQPKLPSMHSEWRGFKIDRGHLERFLKICRLAPSRTMPLVYPLAFVFPLHLGMVGHHEFPLLYVRMMQIRNHVIQHRPIELQETMDISCTIVGHRVAAKGLEMEIHTALEAAGDPAWESLITYFFPGDFGEPDPPSQLSELPVVSAEHVDKPWRMPNGGGFCFGLMSGDYNAIHYLAPYARSMGFRRDFAHSQLSLALCVRHLPPFRDDRPVRLDAAIKGPVYYGSNVNMKYLADGEHHPFDLYCEGNPRPCIRGCLSTAEPDFDLMWNDLSRLMGE